MRKVLIAVIVLAVLAGGGYFLLKGGADTQLKLAVDASLHRLPPDIQVSYDSLDVSPVQRNVTVKGLVVHYAKDPSFEVKVADLVVENPSLGFSDAWAKASADPAAVAPETVLPIADAVTADAVSFKSSTSSGTIASTRTTGLRVYPWAVTRPGLPSVAQVLALLPELQKPNPTPDQIAPLVRLYAAVAVSGAYDRTEMTDLTITGQVAATPQMPNGNFVETIKKISADGVDRGIIKSITAEGIAMKMGDQVNMAFDTFRYADVDFRQPAMRLADGAKLDATLLDRLSIGRMEAAGLHVQMPNGPPLTFGGMGIANLAFANGLPVSGGMTLTDLHMTKAQMPDPSSKEGFDKLGLDAVTISFSAAYEYDPVRKHATIHDTALKVDELGSLDLAADAVDVEPSSDWTKGAKLGHALLHYHDASLVDRAFKAEANGGDPAALRQQAILSVQLGSAMFASDPAATEAVKQVVVFLTTPRSLTVELSPKQPIGMDQLGGAAPAPDLPSRLGLRVKAND